MKRVIYYLVTCLFAILCLSCVRRQESKDKPSVVVLNVDSIFVDMGRQKIEKRCKRIDEVFTKMSGSAFNGVVLYAEQGRVLYRKAFGVRELTRRHPDSLRVDDQFQISSDSKMFTAEAIMLLHAQGKLEYDDEVRKYIHELPYDGVTIRHLLHHCSGLPRYDSMADAYWPDRTKPFSNEAMIAMLAEKTPAPYGTPGGGYFYNNINYALLASVVERVSGQHFEDYMRESIFEPLGMSRSFIYSLRDEPLVPLYMKCDVRGHELYKKGAVVVQDDYLNGVVGDKIMFSTVDDLYRFMLALDCNLLLPDSLQNEAFKPGLTHWKRDENYGFGWRMSKEHPEYVFHFGWWKGYKSEIFKSLNGNQCLIVLSNTTYDVPVLPLWELLEDSKARLPQVSLIPAAVKGVLGWTDSREKCQ